MTSGQDAARGAQPTVTLCRATAANVEFIRQLAPHFAASGAPVWREAAWARSRGYRYLALDTFGDNTHARAVYRHLGFAEESLKLVKVV